MILILRIPIPSWISQCRQPDEIHPEAFGELSRSRPLGTCSRQEFCALMPVALVKLKLPSLSDWFVNCRVQLTVGRCWCNQQIITGVGHAAGAAHHQAVSRKRNRSNHRPADDDHGQRAIRVDVIGVPVQPGGQRRKNYFAECAAVTRRVEKFEAVARASAVAPMLVMISVPPQASVSKTLATLFANGALLTSK